MHLGPAHFRHEAQYLGPHVPGFDQPPLDLVEVRQAQHRPPVPVSVLWGALLEGQLRLLERRLEDRGGGREALEALVGPRELQQRVDADLALQLRPPGAVAVSQTDELQ